MANEGTIRIHRSIAGTGAAFRVSFVPYDAEEETGGERSFRELQQVRAFLKMLGLGAEYIKDALRQLTAGRSASVPNVSLSEKAVKSAGFVSVDRRGSRYQGRRRRRSGRLGPPLRRLHRRRQRLLLGGPG